MTDINTDFSDSGIEADNLDDFTADLFPAEKPVVEDTPEESEQDTDTVPTSTDDESEAPEGDEEGTEEPEDSDEPEDTPPAKEKKKSRFQERIDDLTAKLREKDAQIDKVLAKLEEVTAAKAKPETADEPQNTTKTSRELVEPTADDLNEDGSLKYPLGEFDPKLLRDLTRYDRAVERAHEEKVAAETRAEAAKAQELDALQTQWNDKVVTAKEQYPDYVEKGQALLEELSDIPQDYAVYLTTSLMNMEYGPDVFYYLAEHPEEARVIVNSSPEKALTRLGRIEARFEIAADERSGKETKLRTTNAPAPAPRNKGSNATPPAVDLENADLDAFAQELFPRRR